MAKPFRILNKKLGLVGLVVLAFGGVVYAVLLSNFATITGSSISTASANLQVSTDGVHYAEQVSGFDFSNIAPGMQPQPAEGKVISLRNSGTSRLALRLKVDPLQAGLSNTIDLSRVYVVLTHNGTPQQYPLSTLTSGQQTQLGSSIDSGQNIDYRLQVRIDDGAIANTTQPLTIDGINLVFDGSTESV